jgi:ferredoxin-NADP reductase
VTTIEDVTPRPTTWTTGIIIDKQLPTPTTVRLRMHVEDRQRHWPGQHYLIRLRAPDDYTAQRSYSLASDADDPLLEFLVERLPGGVFSEFLAEVAEVGDVLELRGPIGRWFTWDVRTPALCLVGGTGVVPAVAMTRAARHAGRTDLLKVAAVGRGSRELPYVEELTKYGATLGFTREETRSRPAGPLVAADVEPLLEGAELVYVCGSSRFAEYAEGLVLGLGVPAERVRVEQFGATG